MTHWTRRLAPLAAFVALACSMSGTARAATTADVNCRAWGARYDAPAMLDRLLSKRPSQRAELARRVCGKRVRPETMSIIGQVPRSKAQYRPNIAIIDAMATNRD